MCQLLFPFLPRVNPGAVLFWEEMGVACCLLVVYSILPEILYRYLSDTQIAG